MGMLACALQDEQVNHLVIILYSEQEKRKSTWIRRLLPPQWREYYRNGMVNPDNKDHQLLLSTHLIINMEEFEGARSPILAPSNSSILMMRGVLSSSWWSLLSGFTIPFR